MSGTTTFSGSLASKRKPVLVELADALSLPSNGTIPDLTQLIQKHLDENEAELSASPRFAGLYGRKPRHSTSETDIEISPDVKNGVEASVKKARRSVNKAVEKVSSSIDPANVALPDTPVVQRIANAAERATDAAQESLSLALAPAQGAQQDLSLQLRQASGHLTRFGSDSKARVDRYVQLLREHLTRPEHLVSAAVGIELLFLLCHVVQFYDHAVFFPPPGGDKGTFSSLLHSLFFWLPTMSINVRSPELYALRPSSSLWPAVVWWATTTVLPPFALSTLVNYKPQSGASQTRGSKQSPTHGSTPTADPLTFALIRLAILVYPLTDAAPSAFVDSLAISGNIQGRVLGAALLAALLLVGRITGV